MKNNLDNMFKKELQDMEVTPNPEVWNNIQSNLKQPKSPLYWLVPTGIAAGLLIFYGIYQASSDSANDKEIVVDEIINKDSNETPSKNNVIKHYEDVLVSDKNNEDVIIHENQDTNENAVIKQNDLVSNEETHDKNDSKQNSVINNQKNHSKNKTIEIVNNQNAPKEQIKKQVLQNDNNVLENAIKEKNQKELLVEKEESLNKQSKTKDNEGGLQQITTTQNHQQIAGNENVEKTTADKNKKNNKLLDNKENYTKNVALQNATNNTKNVKNNTEEPTQKEALAIEDNTLQDELDRLEELLKKENTTNSKSNRWQLSSNVAPIFMGSLSSGSALGNQFANNQRNYETTMSYGVGFQYALNDKLILRTGINNVQLSYNTQDVLFFTDVMGGVALGNVNFSQGIDFSNIVLTSKGNEVLSSYNFGITNNIGALNQQMGFFEIPLELSYQMNEGKKFKVQFIGGFSSLFLNRNVVYLRDNKGFMELGTANNINSMHWSTNVGFGFQYLFNNNWSMQTEPMLKYQINTFDKTTEFSPFWFGIQTGINYRF